MPVIVMTIAKYHKLLFFDKIEMAEIAIEI
jgi:hypothetical protein